MKSRAVLTIIIPLVILAVALATGSVLMLRLFSVAVLALSLSYLWARVGIRGITVEVKKSAERCQAGGRFNEEITVFSSSRIPKFLVTVEENTTLPGHHNVAVFNLSTKGYYVWQAQFDCRRRGQYTLGPLTVTVADPFGFFPLRRNMGEPQSIIVYPATLELPFFQLPSHHEPGPGSSRWLISEIGPNAARVREYTSGDTLNRIHWRSTAHAGKLMVKEFDADRSDYAAKNTWIVLDMHRASQSGDGDESTEEYGITIAASLIKKYVDGGQQVGLIASGDQPYFFPPETGSQHLWHILEALALMKATGEVPVERLISHEIERFGINSVIIVISPVISERMSALLRQVRNHGALVIIISLDSASFGGTARAVNATGSLVSSGLKVYDIKRGEYLERALDSRSSSYR
mgnify:FL=1